MTNSANTLISLRARIVMDFNASKGGEVRGVTEDHRHEMLQQMRALDRAIKTLWEDEQCQSQ